MEQYFSDHCLVLKSEPIGEYDRRMVLLTKDHGKISAFAKGARRQNNKFTASTDMFCFGEYKFYAGQNSYSVVDANVKNYFDELRNDMNGALYGMYFLEVMDYLTRENNDEELMLRLLYHSLRALISKTFDNELVKAVFEIKTMILSGEFRPISDEKYSEALKYTVGYLSSSKVDKTYTFTLKQDVLNELRVFSEDRKKLMWNHEFKSETLLKIIET